MRLIEQTILEFRDGASDKVYEVDLCEAGAGEFLVNFRYGRRGARLQEGTKTVFPLPLEKARAIFQSLIQEKTRKGYWVKGSVAEDEIPVPAPTRKKATGNQAARKAVQKHLNAALRDEGDETRKLSRLIWRAGQMNLSESMKTLTKLSALDFFDEYSLAWSLGRIGSADALPRLRELMLTASPVVRRVAIEASLLCMPDDQKTLFLQSLDIAVPSQWLEDLESMSMADRAAWIIQNHRPTGDDELIYHLYVLGSCDFRARELVWWIMHTLPMQAPWRRSIRSIYKAAELRLDGEMYGLCARRFEVGIERIDRAKVFSKASTQYFVRRQRRLFAQAAKDGDVAAYITLAVGVLLAYDDSRKVSPFSTTKMRIVGRKYETTTIQYDDQATWLGFNQLLYANSPRYEMQGRLWSCKSGYFPGGQMPDGREEEQPKFWDQAPDAIKHLLAQSRAERVHAFARKVWQANPSFADTEDIPFVCQLLVSPYVQTSALGLELARKWFDPVAPQAALVVALCQSSHEEARAFGAQCLISHQSLLAHLTEVTIPLLLTPQILLHQLLRQQLVAQQGDVLLEATIVALLGLHANQQAEAAMAIETITFLCATSFSLVAEKHVQALLDHPLLALPLFAVQILWAKPIDVVTDEQFSRLCHSPHTELRTAGMQLWNRLSDAALLERGALMADYCVSPQTEMRQGVRPMIARLAAQDTQFAAMMVLRLYPRLLREEDEVGMHEDVYKILVGPLKANLVEIEAGHRLRMLDSRYRHAQLLGLHLLKHFVDLRELSMAQIVKLGSAETREVREFIWQYMEQQVSRAKLERETSVLLLESDWEDTRIFARDYFSKHFDESDWTPDLLVSLCDNIRADVQDFGKQMITQFFREQYGAMYLQKLSQHPSSHLQFFASNYLERYATGNLERMQSMEWFFLSVLSRVNQGRVVKQRLLHFIRKESAVNEQIATWVMPILARQSLTVAIEEKAAIMKIMQELIQLWPQIPSPLVIKEVPIRRPWEMTKQP